jgi:hypothetical protein
MSVRWQEREYEDDLLKRELVLRLLEEHYGTSGGVAPATDHFYLRARRMMLRHPLFAVRYSLFALDLALGRLEDRDEDCEPGDADAGPTIAAGLTLEFDRRSQPLPIRAIRIRRRDGRVVAVSVISAQERRLNVQVRPFLDCRNWRSAVRLQLEGLYERILAVGRICAFARAVLAAHLARQRAATLVDLVGKPSQQRLVLRARLVRLERASRSARAGLVAEMRRARRLLVAHRIRTGLLGRRAVAVATRAMLRRRILYARLLRVSHDVRAALRRARPAWQGRLVRAERVLAAASAVLVAKVRWSSASMLVRLRRSSRGALTAFATDVRRQLQTVLSYLTDVARRVAVSSRVVVAVPRPRRAHRPLPTAYAVLAAILLTTATATVWTQVSGPSRGIPGTASPERLSPLLPSWHPPRAVSIPTNRTRHRKAARSVEHPTRPKKETHVRQTVLVADTVPTTSLPPSVAAQTGGPAPLPAPAGNSAPSPLKAP